MPCVSRSVDTGSHLASAGVKEKELHLFNFSLTVKQILDLNRARSDTGFCSVWITYGLKSRKVKKMQQWTRALPQFHIPLFLLFWIKTCMMQGSILLRNVHCLFLWTARWVFVASFYLSSISMQCLVVECNKAVHQSMICNRAKVFRFSFWVCAIFLPTIHNETQMW